MLIEDLKKHFLSDWSDESSHLDFEITHARSLQKTLVFIVVFITYLTPAADKNKEKEEKYKQYITAIKAG